MFIPSCIDRRTLPLLDNPPSSIALTIGSKRGRDETNEDEEQDSSKDADDSIIHSIED